MAIELTTLIRTSLDNSEKTRWNCFDRKSLKSLRIQDIFDQSKYAHGLWNNCIVRYFIFKKINRLIKEELSSRKITLLPKLQGKVKSLLHTEANVAEKLREDKDFKIFKRNELELAARTHNTISSDNWLDAKQLMRNRLEASEGVDLDALRKIPAGKLKFKAGSPHSLTLARAVVALNFHPELRPTMPKRVIQALNQVKEMESYFLHMKCETLPEIVYAIKRMRRDGLDLQFQLRILKIDPRFFVYTDADLHLLLHTEIFYRENEWLEFKRIKMKEIFEKHNMDEIVTPLLEIPEEKLDEILKYFQESPDTVEPEKWLDVAARASIAFAGHSELIPILPVKVKQFLNKLQSLPKVKDHFEYLQSLDKAIEDNNMSGIVTSLREIPEDRLNDILEYFQMKRDTVENLKWLDIAARASIAFAIYPELIPIFPFKMKQFLTNLQSLSKVGDHFQSLLKAKLEKPPMDLGKLITEESIAHEDVPIYPLFESDRKRSFNLFLQIFEKKDNLNEGPQQISRPYVCFSEEQKLMEEIQFLVNKYNLDKSGRIMLQKLLSTDGYGLPIGLYKNALISQTNQPFFFPLETERTPLHIKISEKENGELHFDYVYKGVVTDAKHSYACDMDLSRTIGHLQYSLRYSMKRDPLTQQYFVEGPTLSPIKFTIDNPK